MKDLYRLNNIQIITCEFELSYQCLKFKNVNANFHVLDFLTGIKILKTGELTQHWCNLCTDAKKLKIKGDLKKDVKNFPCVETCKFIVGSLEVLK